MKRHTFWAPIGWGATSGAAHCTEAASHWPSALQRPRFSTVIGVILGSVSGYYRGKADQIIMRFTDVVMTFPRVVIILTAAIYLGQSIASVIFLIGIFSWPGLTRLVRGQVLSLREQQFVLASRSLGSGNRRIIVTHVLPNVIAPLLASVTFAVNGAILLEAGLSFLGVGIPLSNAKLGKHAGNRPQPRRAPGRPVDLGTPGGDDSADCPEHQLHRRRPARCHRSQVSAGLTAKNEPPFSLRNLHKAIPVITLLASEYAVDQRDRLKSLATTSTEGSGFRSVFWSGPCSRGRWTNAVLKPTAFEAFRSPLWAATINTWRGSNPNRAAAILYTSGSGL